MSQGLSLEGAAEAGNMGLAWMFCIAGGVAMASYPVFVKVPRVVEAKVSPFIFQSYKSFWVFVLAFTIFLLANYLRAKPLFAFTWWATAASALWVPAGFATIAAVPLCGVATTAVFTTCVNSVVQFFASLLLTSTMKTHGASHIPLAPVYLAAALLGMLGLILSPRIRCAGNAVDAGAVKLNSEAETASTLSVSMGLEDASVLMPEGSKPESSRRDFFVGVLLACLAGLFSAMKFAVKSYGEHYSCVDSCDSKYAIFQSYMMSFGVGCMLTTPLYVGTFGLWQKGIRHKELPSAEFSVMKIYGFLAGLMWFAGYMGQQAANDLGGQGAMGPAGNASQLITAGLWGILYYREMKDPMQIAFWVLSAAWTITSVILLSKELVKRPDDLF
jgi:hypothetical protein